MKHLRKIGSMVIVAAFIAGAGYLVASGWTGPTLAPPATENGTAPIRPVSSRVVGSPGSQKVYVGVNVADFNKITERLTVSDGSVAQLPNPVLSVVGIGTSSVDPSGSPSGFFVAGRYGYGVLDCFSSVAGGCASTNQVFRVVDLSDPTNPVPVGGSVITEVAPNGTFSKLCGVGMTFCPGGAVFVSGRYAYLVLDTRTAASGNKKVSALRILDITNPEIPKSIGGANLGSDGDMPDSNPTSIFVSGRYAYMTFAGVGTNAFRIIDVSDPTAPNALGNSLSLPSTAYGVFVQGKYAYVAFRPAGFPSELKVIDVSNPANPLVVGTCCTPSLPQLFWKMHISGRYAYLGFQNADKANNFRIIDLADPTAPVDIGMNWSSQDIPDHNVFGVVVSGRYGYLIFGVPSGIGQNENKIRVLDVSDPKNPVVVAKSSQSGFALPNVTPQNVSLSGKYLYVIFLASGQDFMRVIDVSGLESVSAVAHSLTAGSAQVLANTQIANNLVVRGGLTVGGNVFINGNISKPAGTFEIPHPLDPESSLLRHSFVEAPERKNFYDGVAALDQKGEAVVALPEYFEALNAGFRYQLSPESGAMPNIFIRQEVKNNRFTISGGVPGGLVSWQVTGVRIDPWASANPLVAEEKKD